jgi:hypothetical protein
MDEFYLLVTATRKRVKGSKLQQTPKRATRITRVAKCKCVGDPYDSRNPGQWWSIEVFGNPIPLMLDLVFVGSKVDPGVRAAEALAERMVSGLSLASGVKWEANCGPIDAEDAALLRIELEVV